MREQPLLFFACVELLISLGLAWLGVATMYLRVPPLPRVFKRPNYIIKAHIDYLLMALLLMAFHGIGVPLPAWVVVCAIAGSLANPLLFLVLAAIEQPDYSPFRWLGITSTVGFLLTTLGFGGAAVVVLAGM
ncbi:MAG: hypothetical protein GC168_15625 [Candidatus Hydrogenedens sp.]|nr:hypothetical protein [Candidatus Hydrogenedens sp.]